MSAIVGRATMSMPGLLSDDVRSAAAMQQHSARFFYLTYYDRLRLYWNDCRIN